MILSDVSLKVYNSTIYSGYEGVINEGFVS